MTVDRGLPFHIREFRCHFPVAYGEDVDAMQMPRLSVAYLATHPPHYGTITTDDNFLGLESSTGIAREPLPPERDHRGLSFYALAIWRGDVSSNTVSLVSNNARASVSCRLKVSLKRSTTARVVASAARLILFR